MKNKIQFLLFCSLFCQQMIGMPLTAQSDTTSERLYLCGDRKELPRGTILTLEVCESVSSKSAIVNQQIKLRVVRDVVVEGETVIYGNSFAEGRVVYSDKSKKMGAGGYLAIEAVQVNTVDGQAVILESYPIEFFGESKFMKRGEDAIAPIGFSFRAWTYKTVRVR